ncbi:sensor histidine kinase [Amycolatopsis sp. lyj-90]|uniref:sensor histidine kinase n=1 Tax=Amycolatopsis sp. lyj-90 TaxID=2789285 RepID=UPI0039780DA8
MTTPARVRLRRLRRRLTALYALGTAICLVVLAGIASELDAESRASGLDHEVDRTATALSRALWYDDAGVLHLEPLREDILAAGAVPVTVFEWTSSDDLVQRFPHYSTDAEAVASLAGNARHTQETVLGDALLDGAERRLAAAPVWNGDRIGAVVVARGDPEAGEAGHAGVVRFLAIGCAGLVLLAAAAGHLLSGRSMRPAQRALDRQEQFLAEAAHELRTPLATLQLVTDSGLREPTRGQEALRRSSRLVGELGRLVTGLLVRARLAAGTQALEREPLRLDLLVEQIVTDYDDSRITLTAEPGVVLGDPELLAQAIRNLLDNGIRHGGVDAGIEVGVAGGRISVRDHGPGVHAADRERLFEHAVTGEGGGTGIGLAIVRWVADLHGGSARLGDAEGGGTVAELMLPGHEGVVS